MALILIAEAASAYRQVIATVLRRNGHGVEVAASTAAALARAAEGGVDLLLLSLHAADECEALVQAVRRRPANLPVIVLHALGDAEAARLEAALGSAAMLLSADVSTRQLCDQVRALLPPP